MNPADRCGAEFRDLRRSREKRSCGIGATARRSDERRCARVVAVTVATGGVTGAVAAVGHVGLFVGLCVASGVRARDWQGTSADVGVREWEG